MIRLEQARITPEEWKRSGQPKGTWYAFPITGAEVMRGERMYRRRRTMLFVACPQCGYTMEISADVHGVAPDGVLKPSLVCAKACGWHVFVQLADWGLD